MDDRTDLQRMLAEFRQSQLSEHALPGSGLTVKLKKVGLEDLLFQGEIPDTLSGLVEQAISGKGMELSLSGTDLPMVLDMMNLVTRAALVWPPVADTGDDEHLGLDELPFVDKEYIFDFCNGGANALKPFRTESNEEPDPAAPAG